MEQMHGAGVPHVIKLMGRKSPSGDAHLLVTWPWGRHLTIDDPADVIMTAIGRAAMTLQKMAELPVPHCHGDLSLGNMIITRSHDAQDGSSWDFYLLDWVTLQPAKPAEKANTLEITGTLTYMAISVLSGFANTVSSDLESLALVLIFLAAKGSCPWVNSRQWDESRYSKAYHLGPAWKLFADEYLGKGPLREAAQRLRALFWASDKSFHGHQEHYNVQVSPAEFLQALDLPAAH